MRHTNCMTGSREENFTTPYLKTVSDRKMEEEKAAAYMAGFLSKCAEYGVDGRLALELIASRYR